MGVDWLGRGMANVNKIILVGRITRDLDVQTTPKGTSVVEMGLAVNRSRAGEDGERIEETTWVDVTLWGKTAENVAKYMSKGREVYVAGRLELDSWEDKDSGKMRSKLRVVGEDVQFLGSKT